MNNLRSSSLPLLFLFLPSAFATCLHGATLPDVQSIRITNTRADWFYLEELRILNEQGDDVASLAFGALAASSEEPGFASSLEGAIDDLRGECCETGWHSSTSAGDQTYTITLPSSQTLSGEITVWDREDICCSQRLDGMLFEFFDGPEATGNLLAAKQVDNLAADSFGEINTETGASFPLPDVDADSDGDGLVDRYEEANDLDPNDATGDHGAQGDPDQDGSTNLEEFERGTDPQNPDTDDDGLLDGVESGTGQWVSPEDTGTDPLDPDSDGDTLPDGVETNTMIFVSAEDTGTDPNEIDSDGDGIADHRELFFQTDPNDAASKPVIAAAMTGVRSIRITNQLVDWFYVEELELFNTADLDVFSTAFGTTGTASEEPGFGGNVAGPVDDIFGSCCANGYHSSTEGGGQSLTYTFPERQDLTGDIRIWNRTDACCAERLDGMLFEFFDGEDGSGELIASQLIEGLGSERAEELSSPQGATVPLIVVAPTGPLHLSISALSDRAALQLAWNSNPSEFFALEMSDSLEPDAWTLLESHFPAAEPPAEGTVFTIDDPSGRTGFYRLRRVPPPPILSEDFEMPATDWLAEASDLLPFPNEGATRFEQGPPSAGPGAAHGGTQVFATNLTGPYDELLNITLTSPIIDLTRERAAHLRFWYTLETGLAEGARLEFIDADDGTTILAQTEPFPQASDWTQMEFDLTEIEDDGPSVAGERIRLRFRFLSDDNPTDNGAGLTLDDVLVER